MGVFHTDSSFKQYETNPYDINKPYDDNWILLKLLEKADDFQQMTTGGKGSVFRFIMTKELRDWQYRTCDFIQYESTYDKNIILAVNEDDLEKATIDYGEHCYNDNFLREYESKILVHTTTKENFKKIMSTGELKSWNASKEEYEEWEEEPIGNVIGDPVNYRNYVMFGTGGIWQELIPLSKQRGYIDMNIDSLYTAGARLYFDAQKIADDGFLIRDGVHLKVKDRLNLCKYLLWTATSGELGLPEQTTPRIFAETADCVFTKKFGIRLEDTCY